MEHRQHRRIYTNCVHVFVWPYQFICMAHENTKFHVNDTKKITWDESRITNSTNAHRCWHTKMDPKIFAKNKTLHISHRCRRFAFNGICDPTVWNRKNLLKAPLEHSQSRLNVLCYVRTKHLLDVIHHKYAYIESNKPQTNMDTNWELVEI